jgi:hypothetical protein
MMMACGKNSFQLAPALHMERLRLAQSPRQSLPLFLRAQTLRPNAATRRQGNAKPMHFLNRYPNDSHVTLNPHIPATTIRHQNLGPASSERPITHSPTTKIPNTAPTTIPAKNHAPEIIAKPPAQPCSMPDQPVAPETPKPSAEQA